MLLCENPRGLALRITSVTQTQFGILTGVSVYQQKMIW